MEQNQDKKLNFKINPVEVLTLQDLEKTHKENYPDGTPVGDIYHHQLLNTIVEACDGAGLKPELKEVFAVNNRYKRAPGVTILPEIEASHGEGSLESHILRRVFANITLHGEFSSELHTYNIAVSYTQLGILVGFGPFTYACHNQTIMSAKDLVSNYTLRGNQRLETKEREIKVLIQTIREKIALLSDRAYKQINQLEELKGVSFDPRAINELVGIMVKKRVECETDMVDVHVNGYPPLNSAHINQFSLHCMNNNYYRDGASAYDLYQAGTNLMKPQGVPFEMICPQSYALYKVISDYANISYDFSE